MKLRVFLFLPLSSLVLIATSCQGDERTVVVTETAHSYQLVAFYPASRYALVAQFVHARLPAAPLIAGRSSCTVRIKPGQLCLTFDKQAQAPAATASMRQMGRELTAVVTTGQ